MNNNDTLKNNHNNNWANNNMQNNNVNNNVKVFPNNNTQNSNTSNNVKVFPINNMQNNNINSNVKVLPINNTQNNNKQANYAGFNNNGVAQHQIKPMQNNAKQPYLPNVRFGNLQKPYMLNGRAQPMHKNPYAMNNAIPVMYKQFATNVPAFNRPNPYLLNLQQQYMQKPNVQARIYPNNYIKEIPVVSVKTNSTIKKKTWVIWISSFLAIVAVATTAVLVPFALINKQSNTMPPINYPVFGTIKNIYDLPNGIANLFITGENLPTNKDLFFVFNISNPANKTLIDPSNVALNANVDGITLVVRDPTIASNSVYEVALSGTTPIISSSYNNMPQPSFRITQQPVNQFVVNSSTKTVNLSISISSVTNSIQGASLSYQWYISNVNDPTNEKTWDEIKGANSATYTYNISGLLDRKFFRCKVGYKYATPVFSNVATVKKIIKPTINISANLTNQVIAHNADTPTLTISAAIVNSPIQQLNYQWFISNDGVSNWISITNANSSSYKVDTVTTVKKYYKCEISHQDAQTITSNIVYVERLSQNIPPPSLVPILSFVNQPISSGLPYTEQNITFTVDVAVANPTSNASPTYQWFVLNDNVWTIINNATQNSYTYNLQNLTPQTKKFFRCQVDYPGATQIISNTAFAWRASPTPSLV